MYRDLQNDLIEWKTHPFRKPLLLRGARQVGKSWLAGELGKGFPSVVEINFEREASAKALFEGDLDVAKLLEKLSLYSGKSILPGETLLFLDEVQECEGAIKSLRYFKEECPELHVIAAGSLVDFAIEKLGLPVGRIQFLHLHPLSFGEFLLALGRGDLRRYVLTGRVERVIHDQLLDLLKTYLWLGGMPAVIDAWIAKRDVALCQGIQDEIIGTYRQDFEKYARRRQAPLVERVFESVPTQIGTKFTYLRADPHARSNAVRDALMLLEKAGVVVPAFHSPGQGIPLGAGRDEKKFKAFLFDVGLAQRMLGLDLRSWVVSPLKVVNIGAVAEQFVAQELIAYGRPTSKPELHYWHREVAASSAEVDFLVPKDGMVVPIEVKSGTRGGLKSMQLFLDSHPSSKYGLKVSECPFSSHGRIREIPLYGLEAWVKGAPAVEFAASP